MIVPGIVWYIIGGILVAGIISMIPVMKVVNSVAPFAYPNARIRAMKTRMVSDEEFKNLAKRPYTDVLTTLESHSYPELTKGLGADLSFAKVDTALRAHYILELEKIKRISPQQTKGYVNALLAKYDIQIIESIVRSGNTPQAKTSELLHQTQLFSKEFLTRSKYTYQDLLNELKGTIYAEILKKHQDQAQEGRYAELEQELDLYYFSQLRAAAKSTAAKRHTKTMIDSHNISLSLKGLTPIIPGGKIHRESIHTKDINTLTQALHTAGYPAQGETPEALEKAIQLDMKAFANTLLSQDPLSENSIVGYLALKRINIRNTSILLNMKAHKFPEQKILEVLAL